VLWAAPEERTGGRLRLNSLCGINLAGHALTRAHRRYDYLYAPSQDAAALERLRTLAKAGRALRLLKGARLGRIGEHPAGFDTCRVDREALRQTFGVEVVQVELNQVFEETRQTEAEAVNAVAGELQGKVGGLDQVDQTALRRSLGAYVALRRLADHEKLNGFAVRCWPEFFTELGCAACGAMSMLSDEFTPCSCEADVNGTLTQMLLQWISGEPAFGTDLVEFNPQENSAVLWHCGLAPLAMADPTVAPHAAIHSNRRLPLLMEFPLKPGRVTLARLSEATGSYRLVAGGGEMLQAPISFSGTSGVIRFDRPAAEVLDTILGEGLEHHLSLTYGDHVPVLLALAKFLDMPVLRLA
jgi:L-fucose isomerase-like protein